MTKTTPKYSLTPDYSPVVRLMAMQTRFAIETSQGMMKLAMLPWAGMPVGFTSICGPFGSARLKTDVVETTPAPKTAEKPVKKKAEKPVETVAKPVEPVVEPVKAPAKPVLASTSAPVAEAKPAPKPTKAVETAAPVKEPVAEVVAEVADAPVADVPVADAAAMKKPKMMKAPKGTADDLTLLNGVGPKLADALNEKGIYHFSQIAAWTEENVAWVDENLPGVRGRASRNGWVAQAADLVK